MRWWLVLVWLVACDRQSYIFDDDLGTPDAAMALLYLLDEPTAQVIGVVCSYGSVNLDACVENAAEILRAAGKEGVPILRGAGGRRDLGQRTEATDFVLRAVSLGRVNIVSSGPLTNLATFLMLGAQFDTLSLIGADVMLDVEAAKTVLADPHPMMVYPEELLRAVAFDAEDFEALRRAGTSLSKFVLNQAKPMGTVFYPRCMTGMGAILDPYFRSNVELVGVSASTGGVVRDNAALSRDVVFGFNDAAKFKRRFRERLVR